MVVILYKPFTEFKENVLYVNVNLAMKRPI